MVSLSTALSNQRGEAETIFRRAARRRAQEALRIACLERHIARLDNEIARRIDGDEVLVTRYRILLSIEGGGPVAAITLLVCLAGLNEIGLCSGKAAAMLPGLAPLACDSGDKKGQRHIRGGRAHVRTTLSMAAAAASRTNPDLAGFYKRLSEKGKAAKIAIVAVIQKRVVLANTLNMLDQPLKRTYSPETIARRKAILARNRAALAAIRKSLKPKPPAKVWRPRLADVENLLGMSSGFRGMTHRKSPCRQAFQPRFFRLGSRGCASRFNPARSRR